MSGRRIVFADELRGVAALAVATSHLVGVYWLLREAVSAATFTAPQPGPIHPWAMAIVFRWFSLGPFGVGLFFLISGLVIPFSLTTHGRVSFLAARVLRIYPVYLAAVLLDVLVLAVNAAIYRVPFGHTGWTVLANALLIQDLVGQPSIDLVNWTLSIEMRFYLVVALCAGSVLQGRLLPLFGLALLACGINVAVAAGVFGSTVPDPLLPSYAASTELLFIIFMLVGVLFNFHCRGLLGTAALGLAVAAMVALFLLCWRESVLASQLPGVAENYLCALAVFAALYAVRAHVPPVPGLHQLAKISYPLYVVHPILGYSVLRLGMVRAGLSYPVVLALAAAAVVAAASLLHWLVERPTIKAGHLLGRRRAALVPAAAE